LINPVNW